MLGVYAKYNDCYILSVWQFLSCNVEWVTCVRFICLWHILTGSIVCSMYVDARYIKRLGNLYQPFHKNI